MSSKAPGVRPGRFCIWGPRLRSAPATLGSLRQRVPRWPPTRYLRGPPISDRVSILADVAEIVTRSHDLSETLGNVTALVAKRLDTDVCSIYMVDVEQQRLSLSSTIGLQADAVGARDSAAHPGQWDATGHQSQTCGNSQILAGEPAGRWQMRWGSRTGAGTQRYRE